jgi:hypothetical protein
LKYATTYSILFVEVDSSKLNNYAAEIPPPPRTCYSTTMALLGIIPKKKDLGFLVLGQIKFFFKSN